VRIQSGSSKGKAISTKVSEKTRPTTARVRKAIFDTLFGKFEIANASVLDLFAGTGSLGFEAASRGAAEVDLVDIDRMAANALLRTATSLEEKSSCKFRVWNQNAFIYLRNANRVDHPVDLAFCDPPYLFSEWDDLFSLRPGRFLVVESNRQIAQHPNYNEVTLKVYGDTYVSFRTLAQS
ncbi:unnamed protein product, partial [Acidithrix sp. C25]